MVTALGVHPARKYENEGGPGVREGLRRLKEREKLKQFRLSEIRKRSAPRKRAKG
jgi:hypothetical protein